VAEIGTFEVLVIIGVGLIAVGILAAIAQRLDR